MLKADVALIGGTGIGPRLAAMGGRKAAIPTPYGLLRARLIPHDGRVIAAVERHSAGHKTPPHLVNYRAIASGLKRLGVKGCLSSAAVGCMREEWPIGALANCTDFIDFSFRGLTMHERDVRHVDFSTPFSAQSAIVSAAAELGVEIQPKAVYACTNGPRYETPAEIHLLKQAGADLAGMTAGTEAIVMAEEGVRYGCLAVVTNKAAGMGGNLAHGEVVDVMQTRGEMAVRVLLQAAMVLAGE